VFTENTEYIVLNDVVMEKIFEFNTNYKPEIDNYSSKLEE